MAPGGWVHISYHGYLKLDGRNGTAPAFYVTRPPDRGGSAQDCAPEWCNGGVRAERRSGTGTIYRGRHPIQCAR